MTEQEAIREIQEWKFAFNGNGRLCTMNMALVQKKAVSALEEIQKYREVGTVEQCRRAVECQQTGWVPAHEPPEDESYILLSFENFDLPMV